MSLLPSTCAAAINTANNSTIATWPLSSFAADFASAYESYSQGGVLSLGGGVAGSEDSSIISAFLESFSESTTDADFGAMLSAYWSTCLLVPSGGAISLVNNASSKAADFTAAIAASYRTTDTQPYYLHFVSAIEDVAKTIVWTAVLPVPPFTRLETIS